MGITKDQWAAIGRIILIAVVALAAVFGYDLSVVQPREAQKAQFASQATTRFTSDVWLQNSGMKVDKTLSVTGASTLSGGMTGDVTGNVTSSGSNTLGSATITTATITSLSLNGITVSGPYRYGTATSVVSGTTIAHGFVTTPTCVLTQIGGGITRTIQILSTGATSITVAATGDGAANATSVNWWCGK